MAPFLERQFGLSRITTGFPASRHAAMHFSPTVTVNRKAATTGGRHPPHGDARRMRRLSLAGHRGVPRRARASSGIGRALAVELAREGYRVGLIARRADRLEALAAQIRDEGGCAECVPAGVTGCDEIQRAIAGLTERLGPVDLLVANAGIALKTDAVVPAAEALEAEFARRGRLLRLEGRPHPARRGPAAGLGPGGNPRHHRAPRLRPLGDDRPEPLPNAPADGDRPGGPPHRPRDPPEAEGLRVPVADVSLRPPRGAAPAGSGAREPGPTRQGASRAALSGVVYLGCSRGHHAVNPTLYNHRSAD